MKLPIYLDYHATTPVDPRALEAMLPYLKEDFGNPSSQNHVFGKRASEAVETARGKVAHAIHASEPGEIIFTSGATEANNIAVQGVARLYRDRGRHIIVSAIEHKSVLETARALESEGFSVTYLPVDPEGRVELDRLEDAISEQTILISVMHANNEIGVLEPVAEIGAIAKKRNVFFHCDIAQSVGKVFLDVETMGIDLASISAHKVYGPKGVGALYVRKKNPRVRLAKLFHGGGQEKALRSGTLNVPGIVGFGFAVELAMREMPEESKRILTLREKIRNRITESLDHVCLNGSLSDRLPGNLNLSFPFVEGGTLLKKLSKTLAVSSGSACTESTLEPSYVLRELKISGDAIHTSIRIGIGRFNTEEEINYAADCIIKVVRELREHSAVYREFASTRPF